MWTTHFAKSAMQTAYPGADRSGFLEVVRPLNGCGEGGCGDRTDAGNGHEDAASLALARVPDQLASEFGGAGANAAPGFQHREHDRYKSVLIGKKAREVYSKVLPFPAGTSSRRFS